MILVYSRFSFLFSMYQVIVGAFSQANWLLKFKIRQVLLYNNLFSILLAITRSKSTQKGEIIKNIWIKLTDITWWLQIVKVRRCSLSKGGIQK